jgi:hypothetical protein
LSALNVASSSHNSNNILLFTLVSPSKIISKSVQLIKWIIENNNNNNNDNNNNNNNDNNNNNNNNKTEQNKINKHK